MPGSVLPLVSLIAIFAKGNLRATLGGNQIDLGLAGKTALMDADGARLGGAIAKVFACFQFTGSGLGVKPVGIHKSSLARSK